MSTKSDAFIVKYRPAAEKISAETGIPVARILAQAGFETGWNINPPGNNFFGVKAQPGYEGKSQSLDTKEADSGGNLASTKGSFRVYDNPEDSFRDWAKVLKQDNFKAALDPNLNDAQFATALQAGGYGTDPSYAAKLHGVIAQTRADLGQGPDGSVVTLAQLPSKQIDTVPYPLMQASDAAETAPTAPPVPPGLLAQALKPVNQMMQNQATAGLLAAGQPQYIPPPPMPGLLQPHAPNPNAVAMLPNLRQKLGLLG